MKFNKHLIDNNITPETAAKELSKIMKKKRTYSRQHIWELRTGKANPSFKLMQAIDDWSDHNVTFTDWKR